MRKLGVKQLDLMASLASPGRALVVGNEISRSLCKRGLMEATGIKRSDSFVVLSPAGYRALADAMDAGAVRYKPGPRYTAVPEAR